MEVPAAIMPIAIRGAGNRRCCAKDIVPGSKTYPPESIELYL
jgi:hypothetical protein